MLKVGDKVRINDLPDYNGIFTVEHPSCLMWSDAANKMILVSVIAPDDIIEFRDYFTTLGTKKTVKGNNGEDIDVETLTGFSVTLPIQQISKID